MLRYLSPLAWIRWTGQFLNAWAMSVPWQDAAKGVPALLLLITLGVTGFIAYSDGSSWRSNLVSRQYRAAVDAEDFATAELVLRRQLKESPDNSELLYRLAETRDALDFRDEATGIMRALVENRQHVPAAVWLLQKKYLGGKWSDLEASEKRELGKVLTIVYKQAPGDSRVTALYADYLIINEQAPLAIPLLESLINDQPMQGLRAAAIARQNGMEVQAERIADQTLRVVSQKWKEEPKNVAVSLAVAQNQLFLARHSDAVETIETAIGRAETSQEKQILHTAMGDAIVAWVGFIEQSPTKTLKDRLRSLKMLQLALQYAPSNPRVVTLVVDRVLATVSDDHEQVVALREALVKGTSPGIAHFIEGTAAMMNGDAEKGGNHLQMAAKLMPNSGAILNNLAVAMSTRENPDLEQALKLSETAIQQTPGATPHFFDTRGQILFQMKRYSDAIPDLERALVVASLASSAHKSLAVCYQQIGENEIAQKHREAAQESTSD